MRKPDPLLKPFTQWVLYGNYETECVVHDLRKVLKLPKAPISYNKIAKFFEEHRLKVERVTATVDFSKQNLYVFPPKESLLRQLKVVDHLYPTKVIGAQDRLRLQSFLAWINGPHYKAEATLSEMLDVFLAEHPRHIIGSLDRVLPLGLYKYDTSRGQRRFLFPEYRRYLIPHLERWITAQPVRRGSLTLQKYFEQRSRPLPQHLVGV